MNKEIMKTMGFDEQVKETEAGNCPFCKKQVRISEFRNEKSKAEYKISKLCQKCQDEMWGED